MVGRYGGLVGSLWGMDMSAEQVGLGRSVRLEMRRTRARARIWRIPRPTGYGDRKDDRVVYVLDRVSRFNSNL
jgi:hypothetical protein